MIKYLIAFILNFIIGLVITLVLPFLIFLTIENTIRDMRIRKRINEGTFSYLYTSDKPSRTKIVFIFLSQVTVAVSIVFYLIFIQIPIVRDIPALITGNYLTVEGTVTRIEQYKNFDKIYINNVEIKENKWFMTSIKQYNRYKISYLKYTKSIIKVDKLN